MSDKPYRGGDIIPFKRQFSIANEVFLQLAQVVLL